MTLALLRLAEMTAERPPHVVLKSNVAEFPRRSRMGMGIGSEA